ncbi:molybdopterin molybdotransferase MoeA [Rathayibacter soli]|uniref:molybdopterin molybdotransferase MoeA n=1 Tax=Rathayibacter soli TaxID=3144168 RepID=UPI0027E571F5|nr:gephyrin-like molybdotransferase Glp [Glaciibacter superstes]
MRDDGEVEILPGEGYMTTVAEHQAAVEALLEPLALALRDPQSAEKLELTVDGLIAQPQLYRDRVLARDVAAALALPPFDNSQMDGYAVRAAELAGAAPETSVRIRVGMTIAAGDPVGVLAPGTAAPIMTGAPIPAGADAIVPIERSDPPYFVAADGSSVDGAAADGTAAASTQTVGFAEQPTPGAFVRTVGSDLPVGATLLAAGSRLGPAQWGVLSSGGVVTVPVRPRLRVLVLSTGHELKKPGEPLESGQIYDGNSTVLAVALAECGATVRAAMLPDNPADVVSALAANAAETDLVVTTGGVSAGAFEVVREALAPAGVVFGPVAMQPGGPQGLGVAQFDAANGREAFSVPVVAFPGNPVSTLVSFEMFLRPVLRRLAGLPEHRTVARLPLAQAVESMAGKHQVRRGILNASGAVELIGGASSHLLHSYALSSVLVHFPVGVTRVEAGELVEIWRIDA